MRIRYICHAGQETGYGRAATDLALALIEAGVELQIIPINPSLSHFMEGPQARLAKHVTHGADDGFDVALIHTMPLDCWEATEGSVWCYMDRSDVRGDKIAIAYTTWEGVNVPDHVATAVFTGDATDKFDDVWVPSTATQDAFLNGDEPHGTFVLPHTFDQSWLDRGGGQTTRERFRFCYIGAWTTRKNPHGLIRAYAATFTPDDRVELVIHSPGVSVEMFTAALVATGLEQAEMPKVTLRNERVSDDAMRMMHATYDCFVTATRGEAWNLPAFEAMLGGRMVIAPAGMGHDDFLFEDPDVLPFGGEDPLTSARRVSSFEQPAFVDVRSLEKRGAELAFSTLGAQGLSSKTRWRDPDLVHLGHQMRQAYEGNETGLMFHYNPADRFGHRAVAEKAIARIEHVIQKGRTR